MLVLVMDKRIVNTTLLKEYIRQRKHGLAYLAIESDISLSLIQKVVGGRCPGKHITRIALAKAVGVEEDELFPVDESIAA